MLGRSKFHALYTLDTYLKLIFLIFQLLCSFSNGNLINFNYMPKMWRFPQPSIPRSGITFTKLAQICDPLSKIWMRCSVQLVSVIRLSLKENGLRLRSMASAYQTPFRAGQVRSLTPSLISRTALE